MQLSPQLKDLSKPENIQQLASLLSELAEQLDPLYTESAPNGNISARIGRIAIYKNGSTYEQWQNVDGGTIWQRMDYGIIDYFKTGDWIVSSVTTARTGWTDKSATYSNKFMRINATPLSTGGADTHSHTLTTSSNGNHTHTIGAGSTIGSSATTLDMSTTGDHTHTATTASGDNVPAYVQVCIFEKN